MAAGLPVVASRIGGIPEIIGSPDLGTLVPPDHIDRFAEAVQQLVADPERARAMGRRAAASVVGRFDRETIGGQLADLYCTLLHS